MVVKAENVRPGDFILHQMFSGWSSLETVACIMQYANKFNGLRYFDIVFENDEMQSFCELDDVPITRTYKS